VPLIVIGGLEYGAGSSRDWASKGTDLLGIRAVIAESFERIHRSNLVTMGVLPLQFPAGVTRKTLALDGSEKFDLHGLATLSKRGTVRCTITRANGQTQSLDLLARIDSFAEVAYFQHGGIIKYVLRKKLDGKNSLNPSKSPT
jgi:aconitate hydratase